MASNGFFKLGEALLGGDIDREGAFLEGQDIGSRINLRGSQTKNALAQARLRQQEADQREKLGDALIAANLDPGLAPLLASGVSDFSDVTGGLGDIQEQDFRSTISDVDLSFEERQASAQAVEGEVVNPFQIGPGGELFADVFNPDGLNVTQTGTAAIGADEALAGQRIASGRLSDEKRLHPELFKSTTLLNLGGGGLGDIIASTTGSLNLPDKNIRKAFGAPGFAGGIVNRLGGIVGFLPFENIEQATNALNTIKNSALNTAVLDFPGRPTNFIAQRADALIPAPGELLQGGPDALLKFKQFQSVISRELAGQMQVLELNIFESKAVRDKSRAATLQWAQLGADVDQIITAFEQGSGPTPDENGIVTLPSGATYKVNP